MAINRRQQLLLVAAAVVVGVWLSDKLLITPLTASWKERSARIVRLKKEITQGDMLVERANSIRSRWREMQTNTLPNNISAAETQVLRAFDRWSQDARISVSSLKPQWKRAGEDYMTLQYRCDALGNVEALTRFLYNIEKDPLALRVESVEITSRDNNGDQLAIAVQVSGLLLSPQEPE